MFAQANISPFNLTEPAIVNYKNSNGLTDLGNMKHIDFDIRTQLDAATKILRERGAARSGPQFERLEELDEMVCMESRALYSRYVATAAWRGSIDANTYETVRDTLQKAVECLPENDYREKEKPYAVRQSVEKRLADFEQFSARLPKKIA